MGRSDFRQSVCDRDNCECIVPWCSKEVTPDPDEPGEQHHIIERELWDDGGYHTKNGVSVCNYHHRMAEKNEIPPQAFWRWAEIDRPVVPLNGEPWVLRAEVGEETCGGNFAIDKWGERFETPPHSDIREYHKYPSTRHLLPLYWHSKRGTAKERTGRDDTGLTSVEPLLGIPLVTTVKMDGSNAMLVKDSEEPVRARNGSHAEHVSFDHLKQEYWDRNVYEDLPEHLQVFGENMYAKHSIHYGCDGCCDERNQGPPVEDVFLVFGVFDTRYNIWLSWYETKQVAERIGFPTVPTIHDHRDDENQSFTKENNFKRDYTSIAEDVVDSGNEGIVIRSQYPFHYGQFSESLGKYVRSNHVQTDEHWSHQKVIKNVIQ